MTEQRVSSRYARALLETAIEGKVSDIIFEDFIIVDTTIRNSHELRVFTASPVVQHWLKIKVFNEVFEGKISKLTMTFLKFLLDKKRGELIQSIIVQYEDQYNRLNNKLPVEFESSLALNNEIKKNLIEKVANITQKEIIPEFKVDESLKGGVMVRIDDKVYDATIKHQLELLFKTLVKN